MKHGVFDNPQAKGVGSPPPTPETNGFPKTPKSASSVDSVGRVYCTLPENAAPGEPVTECYIAPETLAKLKEIAGFPQPMQPPAEVLFKIDLSPGKGRGLFATRKIKQGELLSNHRALLLSSTSMPAVLTPDIIRSMMQGESPLTAKSRAAYMSLANTEPDAQSNILGIFDTNCTGTAALNEPEDFDNPRPASHGDCGYSTVCDVISRMNHDCSPNTAQYFIKESLSWRVHAVRDIEQDEELTSTYGLLMVPAMERQEGLDQYSFVCTCDSCMDTDASDARRAALLELDFNVPLLLKWAEDRSLPDDWLVNKCHGQIELLEREGLQCTDEYWEVFVTLMRVYLCFGDIKTAREWATRAYQCQWVHVYRKDGPDVDEVLNEASTKYEQMRIWGLRAKKED
ncbi:hypothetical protein C8F01DRAFT_1243798 [Mycena amicta]|nr:hypothetical protein C8F01DRAFT_1243798 [Mycena amicta]